MCAYVFKFKVHCGSAFEPGASGLPYHCTAPVCVPDVIGALPVWWQKNKKFGFYVDRKNTQPPVGFHCWVVPNQEPGERGPPLKNNFVFFLKFGVVLEGGSSSSRFLIRKPTNKLCSLFNLLFSVLKTKQPLEHKRLKRLQRNKECESKGEPKLECE